MKKLLIFGFILIASNCFSQSFTKSIFNRLSFGIKGGANYSDFANADFENEGLVGFHAGAIVNFKLGEHFAIQEEFLFSSQGAKIKGNLFTEENVKLYYMTVPILVKYRASSGIYFEAGPQVGALIKDDSEETTQRDGEFFKKLDLGVAAGLGFQAKSGLGIGVRYVAGLSKLGDFNASNIKTDFRSNVIQASIFYIF